MDSSLYKQDACTEKEQNDTTYTVAWTYEPIFSEQAKDRCKAEPKHKS